MTYTSPPLKFRHQAGAIRCFYFLKLWYFFSLLNSWFVNCDAPAPLVASPVACFWLYWDVFLLGFFLPLFDHASRFFIELRTRNTFFWWIWWPISLVMALVCFYVFLNRRLCATAWHSGTFDFFGDLEFFCRFSVWYLAIQIFFSCLVEFLFCQYSFLSVFFMSYL